MWYDILVACILVFFTIRGAMKGVVWQLATIPAIVVCFMFADAISNAAGPYIRLEPPLNHWVAMFGAYLILTFICFGIARAVSEWIERNKMKEFDRHLGAVLGLVKGVVLCLILTFTIVTFSEEARASLINSHSGRYAALIMDRLHPILPEKMHDALAKYIHQLDDAPGLDLDAHDHDHDHHDDHDAAPTPADSMWTRWKSILAPEAQRVITDALAMAGDAESRSRIEQNLDTVLKNLSDEDRQAIQRQIGQLSALQLESYLASLRSSNSGNVTPPPISNPSTPSQPTPQERANQLGQQIAAIYTPDSAQRQTHEQDIARRISGLPDDVAVAVLEDWHSDLMRRSSDPDPATNINSTPEQRILSQLQRRGIPVHQLPVSVQQRLQWAQAQTPRPQGGSL